MSIRHDYRMPRPPKPTPKWVEYLATVIVCSVIAIQILISIVG